MRDLAELPTDRIATVVIASLGLFALVPLGLLLWYVVSKGVPGLSRNFFTQTLEAVGPCSQQRQMSRRLLSAICLAHDLAQVGQTGLAPFGELPPPLVG